MNNKDAVITNVLVGEIFGSRGNPILNKVKYAEKSGISRSVWF